MNAATRHPARSGLPALFSLLLFVALCASIAYWALQWLAPAPRPVAPPVATEPGIPPVASAARLFGGAAKGGGALNVQLRGIIHAGSATGSAAIMTVDGSPPKFYRVNAALMPGVTLKAIHARTVVLSEHGAERELPLMAFTAQEGTGAPLRAVPEQSPPQPAQAAPPQGQAQGQSPGQAPGQAQTATAPGAAQASGPTNPGSSAASGDESEGQGQGQRSTRSTRRTRMRDD